MQRRTRSRSRARSQAGASAEEEEIALGLHRLLDKLRKYQPLFKEEDVAAIPFPSDNGNSCTTSLPIPPPISPRLSHSRHDSEALQAHQNHKQFSSYSPPLSSPTIDKRGGKLPSLSLKGTSSSHTMSTSIDLDGPLSSALFVTAVNIFDGKMLTKSKRVAMDALKLVRQAYALIWKDSDYLSVLMDGEPYRGANGSSASQRNHETTSAVSSVPRKNSHGTSRMFFSYAAPFPEHHPNRQLALLLDECIRVLLVYANVSVNFCQNISTNGRVLLLLSFVCCAARRLEEEDEVPYSEDRGSAADIIVGNRNLHTELDELGQVWQGCGIEGRVADALYECYLIEFLLDAALPPAVCSSRYEGLLTAVFEKKRRIISDIVTSRSGFAHVMRVVPLRGLCGLVNMSAFGDAKLRARLLDKMASEGVVERLAREIAFAMEVVLTDEDRTPPSRSPSKRQRSSKSRGASPPHQRSRASTSGLPSRHTSPHVLRSPRKSEGKARKTDDMGTLRVSTGLDRILNTPPTPVERIGQCVDILMLLSSPNLCPPEDSEAPSSPPSRTSASSPPGAVRATTWASHEDALHEISLHLLAICFLSKRHARYAELASLQLYAADCVLQWAAYSGKFYTLVVHALDELLDMIESKDTGCGSRASSQRSSSRPASRSPPRSPPTAKKQSRDAANAPGHQVLRRLLPGDEAGLLPLLTNLLQYTIHAEANATSIQRWFQFLSTRVLPSVFEVPPLTTGRRSSSDWGQRCLEAQQQQTPKGGRATSLPRTSELSTSTLLAEIDTQALEPPVLARDLSRAEVAAVAPYFRFVRQLIEETNWRAGTAALLGKVVLLAYNVIVTHGHRCNLVFGQACACYDVAAPLLLTMQYKSSPRGSRYSSGRRKSAGESSSASYRGSTVLMHQLRIEEEEKEEVQRRNSRSPSKSERKRRELESDDEEEVFIDSSAKSRTPPKQERPQGTPKRGLFLSWFSPSPPAVEEEEDFSPFISSPDGSSMFYDPYSPTNADIDFDDIDHDKKGRIAFDKANRRNDLRAALDEEATPPPRLPPAGASPQPVTQSWTGRLLLRSLLATFSGCDDTSP